MWTSPTQMKEEINDLGSSAFSDGHNPVLTGVEDLAHFAHGLGVGGTGREVAVPVQPSE